MNLIFFPNIRKVREVSNYTLFKKTKRGKFYYQSIWGQLSSHFGWAQKLHDAGGTAWMALAAAVKSVSVMNISFCTSPGRHSPEPAKHKPRRRYDQPARFINLKRCILLPSFRSLEGLQKPACNFIVFFSAQRLERVAAHMWKSPFGGGIFRLPRG